MKLLNMLWSNKIENVPSAFEGGLVEELDAAKVDGDGGPGSFTHVDQMKEKTPDLLFRQLVWRPFVMFCQSANCIDVALLGLRCVAGKLQVFQHPSSQLGHGPSFLWDWLVSHEQEKRKSMQIEKTQKGSSRSPHTSVLTLRFAFKLPQRGLVQQGVCRSWVRSKERDQLQLAWPVK